MLLRLCRHGEFGATIYGNRLPHPAHLKVCLEGQPPSHHRPVRLTSLEPAAVKVHRAGRERQPLAKHIAACVIDHSYI